MSKSQSDSSFIPIFDYTGNGPQGAPIPVSQLPADTSFIWADTVGGGSSGGPVKWGTQCPDGSTAHGSVLVNVAGSNVVVSHWS